MKRTDALFKLAKLLMLKEGDEELFNIVQHDEWEYIIKEANKNLLVPALYVSLKNANFYDKLEDEMLKGYLYEMYILNKQRNEAILKQLKKICFNLNSSGVTPLLLKGAASLSEDYFEDLGVRCMMDVDLLVEKDKIFDAVNILKNMGYNEMDSHLKLGKRWHHYYRMYKSLEPAAVEMHRMIISNKAVKYMGYGYATNESKIGKSSVLDITDEVYFTFLHSEVAHNLYHDFEISLRHLHHNAVLMTKYVNQIDFNKINDLIKNYKLEKIWFEYLWIMKKIFGIEIPFYIPEMKKYESKIKKRMNNKGEFLWKIDKFLYLSKKAFVFENMQNRYDGLKNRYQMLYYAPLRFVTLSYQLAFDSKKRKNIRKSLK